MIYHKWYITSEYTTSEYHTSKHDTSENSTCEYVISEYATFECTTFFGKVPHIFRYITFSGASEGERAR